ncbi:MAG TPA: response regulator [Polyangiaceae bacterium]|nr:response regulator [Polyangiaceae bacterium]
MSELLDILLVEDSAIDAELVERELRAGGLRFTTRRVYDRVSYEAALARPPDLVLSDHALPQFDGLSALVLLKARYPAVPFILVSGTIGEDLAVAAMREGASDYLLKDRLSRLPVAVQSALERARLMQEKRELEARLARAQRLDSLGRLAAGVAHDLNNFILPILVAEGLLRETISEPSQLDLLDTIESSALRSAKVLKQLLSFGRGASGERRPMHLNSAISEISAIIRDTFPKDVRVQVELGAEDVSVLADATQIQQVLMNLCVNARDAMPNGGTLTIRLRIAGIDAAKASKYPGSRPGAHAQLSVKDTGVGIAPEHLAHIFDPFFTTKAPDKGTGLGLASVFGVIESHGGFVQVDSNLGSGSEFHVYLPAHRAEQLPEAAIQTREAPLASEPLVLLVDDGPAILRVLGSSVRRRGYRVLEANDGSSALAEIEQHPGEIAAVVTDLVMPKLDGLALVKAMRARNIDIPVAVMTGAITADQVESFRKLGVREILRKPFGADVFLDSLLRLLAVEKNGNDRRE